MDKDFEIQFKIIELTQEGKSIKEISKEVGVSIFQVHKYRKLHKLTYV
ncbi:MAG: helix-turn-helix domain containing protein [Sphaerochaetaceae bacterium]|nr:helix-turn-helix domain containing protein [Sphaerochaetaceae bacterium]